MPLTPTDKLRMRLNSAGLVWSARSRKSAAASDAGVNSFDKAVNWAFGVNDDATLNDETVLGDMLAAAGWRHLGTLADDRDMLRIAYRMTSLCWRPDRTCKHGVISDCFAQLLKTIESLTRNAETS
jgi:hypothetical protein